MFKILLTEHNKMFLRTLYWLVNIKQMENKKNNNDKQYHFAVCKTCFWTATLLRIKRTINNDISNYDSTSISCPVCFDHQSISLIPLMAH